jgi:hypothetical protein
MHPQNPHEPAVFLALSKSEYQKAGREHHRHASSFYSLESTNCDEFINSAGKSTEQASPMYANKKAGLRPEEVTELP